MESTFSQPSSEPFIVRNELKVTKPRRARQRISFAIHDGTRLSNVPPLPWSPQESLVRLTRATSNHFQPSSKFALSRGEAASSPKSSPSRKRLSAVGVLERPATAPGSLLSRSVFDSSELSESQSPISHCCPNCGTALREFSPERKASRSGRLTSRNQDSDGESSPSTSIQRRADSQVIVDVQPGEPSKTSKQGVPAALVVKKSETGDEGADDVIVSRNFDDWMQQFQETEHSLTSTLTFLKIQFRNLLNSTRRRDVPNAFRAAGCLVLLHKSLEELGTEYADFGWMLKNELAQCIYNHWDTDMGATTAREVKKSDWPVLVRHNLRKNTPWFDAKQDNPFSNSTHKSAMAAVSTKAVDRWCLLTHKVTLGRTFYAWRAFAKRAPQKRRTGRVISNLFNRSRLCLLRQCFCALRLAAQLHLSRTAMVMPEPPPSKAHVSTQTDEVLLLQSPSAVHLDVDIASAPTAAASAEQKPFREARRIARQALAVDPEYFGLYFAPNEDNDCRCHGLLISQRRSSSPHSPNEPEEEEAEDLKPKCAVQTFLRHWFRTECFKARVVHRLLRSKLDPTSVGGAQ
eukprot:RCo020449